MEGRAERSVHDLLREADQVASGEISAADFVVNLDWTLSGIRHAGGEFAPQVTSMVSDAIDDLAIQRAELTPAGARALAEAAAIAARDGDSPGAVAAAHARLVEAGLRAAGPPPEPRPGRVVRPAPASSRPAAGAGRETERPPDPALDSEMARLARRVTPTRAALRPMRVLGMGWAIVISLVGGLLGGLWLDGRFGTSPLLTVLGLALGLLVAGSAVRQLIQETRR